MDKKFNETLSYLGSEYSIRNIDFENVIYRKINDYEIEISGLHSKGTYDATVYLWKNGKVIDSIQDIHSKEELAKHLETVVQEPTRFQD